MTTLDIITITRNDRQGLIATQLSIHNLISDYDVRWIVIDGSDVSNFDIINIVDGSLKNNIHYYFEADEGIYDAMNKGMKFIKSNYCWYLNSGDVFDSENFSHHKLMSILHQGSVFDTPIFLFSYCKSGKIHTARNLWYRYFGMPTCHQSIIVNTQFLEKYDIRFTYGADYKWVLDLTAKFNPNLADLRKDTLCIFDDTGQSSSNYQNYDLDVRNIQIEKFGYLFAFILWGIRKLHRRSFLFSFFLRVRS